MSISSNITEGPSAPPPGAQMAKEFKVGPIRRKPTHPGAIVKSNIEALNMSVNAAAIAIGVGRAALGKLVNQQVALTPEMALRLGVLFDSGPDLWLRLQNEYDLWTARQKIGSELAKIKKAWDASHIPVEE